jgi:arabinofuranosyltransferase
MSQTPSPSGLSRTSTSLLLLVAGVLFALGVAKLHSFTIDDAYISARYARNLAQGHGLVYNPGTPPTEGFSNLTLVLLTALGTRLGGEAIQAAKIVSALCGLLGLLLLALIGRRVLPEHYPWVVLLTATSAPWLVWSVAGLDTTLMALLALLWLYAALRLQEQPAQRAAYWLLALATLLAPLTRPEGLLFLLLQVALLWHWRKRLPSWWSGPPAVLLALAAYELWKVHYFGGLLPLPFYAKVDVPSFQDKFGGLFYLNAFLWGSCGGALAYLALAAAVLPSLGRPGARRWPLLALLALAPFVVFTAAVGADWMPQFRFLVPALPALLLLVVWLGRELVDRFPGPARTLFTCLMAALLLGNASALVRAVQPNEWRSTRLETLHVHRGAAQALRRQGEFLALKGGAQLVVAALDIGALGYYSDARILDMHGLTDPLLAGKDQAFVARAVLAQRPAFIQVYGHVLNGDPTFLREYVEVEGVTGALHVRRDLAARGWNRVQ